VNAGNANAATGAQGLENARRTAEMAAESLNGTSAALRLRVLEQMELSLACLERHRDALAMRLGSGSLNTQSA
ncbi:MAG: hypothetical protein J0I57_13200, partial [Hyphomicrobium sp.]|nr:hypothetical protein [Hyphomicrobium sp.]